MILECISNAWSPKIGDPYLLGWIIAFGYIFVAILSFVVMKRSRRLYSNVSRARLFWLGMTVFLVFLGLNKQLDLQTFLISAVKCHATMAGWYEERREFQLIFVGVVAAVFSVLLVIIAGFFKENLRKDTLGVVGIVFLLVFILVHASYFHYFGVAVIDRFYESGMNWYLELIGIFLVCLQAVIRLKQSLG